MQHELRGFNSWDSYGSSVTEEELKENALFLAQRLKDAGYRYVICDIQWYEPQAKGNVYRENAILCIDTFGRLIPAPNRFPSSVSGKGFLPISQFCHNLGLKFGIHIMRGIPRQAVKLNTPILHSTQHAQDIADTSSFCPWNPDMYGVDASKEGAQAYYDSLLELYASWEIDFLKVDDIANRENELDPYAAKAEIELITKAIQKTGRSIVLSLSPGPAPRNQKEHLENHATMWRISGDFWDEWPKLHKMFELCHRWEGKRKPGTFPDCDMLPLGRLCVRAPYQGEQNRLSRFTFDEKKTMLTLWAITHSPLFIGGVLNTLTQEELFLLTKKEVLHLQASEIPSYQRCRDTSSIVWEAQGQDCLYCAIFNISDNSQTITYVPHRRYRSITNLWTDKEEESLTFTISAHGCELVIVR